MISQHSLSNLLPEDEPSNDNRLPSDNYQASGEQWSMEQHSTENYMPNLESYADYNQQIPNQNYETVQKKDNEIQQDQPYWSPPQDQQNLWSESQTTNLGADEPNQTQYWDNQQIQVSFLMFLKFY